MLFRHSVVLAVLISSLVLGCSAKPSPAPGEGDSSVMAAREPKSTLSAPKTGGSMTAGAGSKTWGGVIAMIPDGWVEEKPINAMRAGQYRLPRDEGDSADVELLLTHFGSNQGGELEANLERWASQVTQPDGRSSREAMVTRTSKVNGLEIVTADVTGTYVAQRSLMDPQAGRFDEKDWRLFNAIIAGPEGSCFVKVVGPARSVERWMPSIEAFLASAKAGH